mmetsp:Transcript_28182/g.43650  ORF Transcript_28182/g.43650 Transcript_28182/m.43650 type:complete len:138 (-) Transcript_28182:1376-1789(-)
MSARSSSSRSAAFLKTQIVTGRVRRWERKPVYVNHMIVYRWVPKESRQTKIVNVTGDGELEDGTSETFPITRARRQRHDRATRSSSRIAKQFQLPAAASAPSLHSEKLSATPATPTTPAQKQLPAQTLEIPRPPTPI